ncbi:hypothetical protein QUC31_011263 [Theobroma cacao]
MGAAPFRREESLTPLLCAILSTSSATLLSTLSSHCIDSLDLNSANANWSSSCCLEEPYKSHLN